MNRTRVDQQARADFELKRTQTWQCNLLPLLLLSCLAGTSRVEQTKSKQQVAGIVFFLLRSFDSDQVAATLVRDLGAARLSMLSLVCANLLMFKPTKSFLSSKSVAAQELFLVPALVETRTKGSTRVVKSGTTTSTPQLQLLFSSLLCSVCVSPSKASRSRVASWAKQEDEEEEEGERRITLARGRCEWPLLLLLLLCSVRAELGESEAGLTLAAKEPHPAVHLRLRLRLLLLLLLLLACFVSSRLVSVCSSRPMRPSERMRERERERGRERGRKRTAATFTFTFARPQHWPRVTSANLEREWPVEVEVLVVAGVVEVEARPTRSGQKQARLERSGSGRSRNERGATGGANWQTRPNRLALTGGPEPSKTRLASIRFSSSRFPLCAGPAAALIKWNQQFSPSSSSNLGWG